VKGSVASEKLCEKLTNFVHHKHFQVKAYGGG